MTEKVLHLIPSKIQQNYKAIQGSFYVTLFLYFTEVKAPLFFF